MKRLTAYVSGKVQRAGYRARVVQIANGMGLRGIIENLNDGRVKIIADGEEEKLKLFESIIDIKNSLIQVSSIEKEYSESGGEFNNFSKLVGLGETDSRLDEGIGVLKDMRELLVSILSKQDETISEIKDTKRCLGGKMDLMLDKQDETVSEIKNTKTCLGDKIYHLGGKMDLMLDKQDETISEIKDTNRSLNDKNDIVELKGDVAEIKTALRTKGII
jgi:acylphosphatase